MLIPFLSLQQYILNSIPEIKEVRVWNNNVLKLQDGQDTVYALPAVFIEFPDQIKWDQLGNGVQIVDPLFIKFHYVESFYDAIDGTQDQNLEIFLKLNTLRDFLQDWMPTTLILPPGGLYDAYAGTYNLPFGVFTRTEEIQDKDHGAIYHFIQTYSTTWVDAKRERPIGGTAAGPLTYQLNKVIPWDVTGFYTVQQYVSYTDGKIYQCILNTTGAHEIPTNTTYFKYIRRQ